MSEDAQKKIFLLILVIVTLHAFYLAITLRRELAYLGGLEEYLAASNQVIPKSSINQPLLQIFSRDNGSNDPYNDWAQQSLGVPAVRSYLAAHPEISPVKVAIISTGINATHEELSGLNLSYNTADSFCDLQPMSDDNGHGTASAGLITALAGNSRGSYGFHQFPLFICRLTTNNPSQIVGPVNYAVEWGAKVILINMEHVPISPGSPLYVALQNASSAGVAVVIPTGNDYDDNLIGDIAGHPNVFAVGAHDQAGVRRPFSDYESNPNFKQVDFLAPGGEIVVPWWKHNGQNNLYRWFGGTSSAGPLAAGALATLFSLKPDLTLAEAKTVLCSGATDHDDLAGGDEDGCGNLNLARSLTHPLLGLTNLPPYFTNVPLDWRPIARGTAYQFDFQTLGEGSGVNYSLVNAPAGAQINSSSGVLTFTPSAEGPAQVSPLVVRAVSSQGEVVYRGKLLIAGTAPLSFSDNLENKEVSQFQSWWQMRTNDSGRIRIDSKDSLGVAGGPSYIELSRWGNSAFGDGIAAADLEFKIEHVGDLLINFDYRTPESDHVANPLLPNGPGTLELTNPANWGDGLAFSLDGITWYRATDLSATSLAWSSRSINLNELLTQFGLNLGDKLYLRFANYAAENGGGLNSDRLLIDNVSLNWQS